jgi:putative oxidoreductase
MQSHFDPSAAIDIFALSSGLLAVRLVLGLYMMAHGAQKLFGWFGGYGISGTSHFFSQLGFRPARLFVVTAGATELASGILVTLGLLGPIGPALMLSVLIVAAVGVHWPNGMFVTSNGIEHTAIFAAGAFALALAGPGLFSVDALLGLQTLWTSAMAWVAIGVAVAGGLANLAARRPSLDQLTN